MSEQRGYGRAADAIVEEIERQIVSGELPDGSPLPYERELVDAHGVSRTVIRESITALSTRGLVETRRGYRPVVRKPGYESAMQAMDGMVKHLLTDISGVRDLYNARIYVERILVRDAALAARKEDIHALQKALEANEAAMDQADEFYETDVAFHGVLYSIPRNPIFPALHSAYTTWLSPYWRDIPKSLVRNQTNFAGHQAIFNAIIERDPNAAEDALVRHLNTAWDIVRVTFE